jgi:hypothetical protein
MKPLGEVLTTKSSAKALVTKHQFKFHSDPGHGWLAVKADLIQTLGISSQISLFSRVKGKTVYLEEDRDMRIFLEAYQERFGRSADMVDLKTSNKNSSIRSMPSFGVEVKS